MDLDARCLGANVILRKLVLERLEDLSSPEELREVVGYLQTTIDLLEGADQQTQTEQTARYACPDCDYVTDNPSKFGGHRAGHETRGRKRTRPKPPPGFPTNLRKRRQALGLTQKRLAMLLGAPFRNDLISDLELGKREPTPEELQVIAEALDTQPEDLA